METIEEAKKEQVVDLNDSQHPNSDFDPSPEDQYPNA
jgi:hypothetical protein